MLIHDFTKTPLFLFSRVIIHLTNGKSNITGPQRLILLLMHAIIKPDSLSYCCFDSCLLFKWKHHVSWQLMHRWPHSHSKQVEKKSIFVRRGQERGVSPCHPEFEQRISPCQRKNEGKRPRERMLTGTPTFLAYLIWDHLCWAFWWQDNVL